MKKRLAENIDEENLEDDADESEQEGACADVETEEDVARENLKRWLAIIADIHMRGGHIDILTYALPDGGIHVEVGGCDMVEKDPAGFLRWLAEGLVLADGPGGEAVTRH